MMGSSTQVNSRLKIHALSNSPINCIRIQKGTNYSVIAQDSNLKLFNIQNTKLVLSYNSYRNNTRPINYFDFISNSNETLLQQQQEQRQQQSICSVSNILQIHDLTRPTPLRHFQPCTTQASSYRFNINSVRSLSSDVLCTVDEGCFVKLYDLRQQSKFKPIQEFKDAQDSLNCVDYDRSGKVFVGGNDGGLYCYDLRAGLLVRDEFQAPVVSVSLGVGGTDFGEDHCVLGLLGKDGCIFDFRRNRITLALRKKETEKEFKVQSKFFRNGVISGSETGEVYIWRDLMNSSQQEEAFKSNSLSLIKKDREVISGEAMRLFEKDNIGDSHNNIITALDSEGSKILVGNGNGQFEVLEMG